MAGLSAAIISVLAVLCAALLAVLLIQRARMRHIAQRLEDFLSCNGRPLEFSVRDDACAPLQNSIAELQNRLALANERTSEESRRASDLTADISHQLKTPLASLRLFCEMDEGAHMDAQLSQIDRMERLIYSLLRLERLCADGYDFTFAEHDVRRIALDAWSSLEQLYPDRHISIEGEAVMRCDEKWLGEALLNLIKNACEHTRPGGSISVRMECGHSGFFLSVEDDGGGVPAGELPRLFDRFYRAKGADSGGVGIGLAIVREIAYRHHGSVYAENAARGLRVCMSIPILDLAIS